MMTPKQVLDAVEVHAARDGEIRIFWLAVLTNRDAFLADVVDQRGTRSIVPCVVRVQGFTDPNALMQDFALVLENCRENFQTAGTAELVAKSGNLNILLIAKNDLRIPLASSPVMLPDWFPLHPSSTQEAGIRDLTWSAAVTLDAEDCCLEDLRRLLFDLDRALVRRLGQALEADSAGMQRLLAAIPEKGEGEMSPADILARVEAQLRAVRNPRSYRPHRGKGTTFVGRIWKKAQQTPVDSLKDALVRPLSSALRMDTSSTHSVPLPISGVLARPVNPITDPSEHFVFALVSAIQAACQFTTAAAHADQYPQFPVVLLRSLSIDLRSALDQLISTLEGEPAGRL
jgi:hypothetical protein